MLFQGRLIFHMVDHKHFPLFHSQWCDQDFRVGLHVSRLQHDYLGVAMRGRIIRRHEGACWHGIDKTVWRRLLGFHLQVHRYFLLHLDLVRWLAVFVTLDFQIHAFMLFLHWERCLVQVVAEAYLFLKRNVIFFLWLFIREVKDCWLNWNVLLFW